jgi:chromosome segregation ATPase
MISAQYKALQEAQFLHEETLRQLRGEIQAQKQQISDLANDQQVSAQPLARLDAIYLRLSELERKIGEDTTDPLINEIAHRLAALESSGGRGPDSRVERLSEQVEELRRRAALPHTDPRTDEMALRIASVEGSLRRAQQTFESEALTGQIQDLQTAARETSENVATELADLRKQLADAQAQTQPDWPGRFDQLESRLAEASEKSEIQELAARLAQLEQSETDDQSAARFEAVSQKVEELAARLDDAANSSTLTELRQKVAALENQISDSSPGPLTDALSARVDQLQEAIEDQSASDAVQALQQRLAALESWNEQSPDAGQAIAELRQRCDTLAERLSAIPEIDVYDSRLAAIEAQLDELSAGESDVEELRQKLSAIEKSGRAESDGRLAELTARLRALELQAEQSSSSANDGRIDRLSSRLDQLELTGGSNGLTNQINELRERVAGLTSQLREGSAGPAPEAITQIDERLALLESSAPTALQRIAMLENRAPVAGSDQADAVAELRQRVDQMVNAGASGSNNSATADILHEIGMRVQALERNGDSGRGGSAPALGEELNERIGRLEAKIAENGGMSRSELQTIVERLSYLEQSSGAPSGEPRGPSPQILEQLISRYEEIDGRLALMEESGAGAAGSGRSSQGMNSVMSELAELRAQLIDLQQNGSGPGVSESFVGKLAEKISSGIAGSEVKAIQMQMYVVYFFLALIGALALSSFFMQ